jgi:hypothetical protein
MKNMKLKNGVEEPDIYPLHGFLKSELRKWGGNTPKFFYQEYFKVINKNTLTYACKSKFVSTFSGFPTPQLGKKTSQLS